MANSISIHVYRFEPTSDATSNVVTSVFQKSQPVAEIASVTPVNTLGGPDIPGLPYLYGKITLKQPSLGQELYVMNSVQDIQNKMNA